MIHGTATLPDGSTASFGVPDPNVVAVEALKLLAAWTHGKPEQVGGADFTLAANAVYVVERVFELAHGHDERPLVDDGGERDTP